MKPSKIMYRAFSSKIYAVDFVNNGKFRLGLIEYYTDIEDEKRKDQTEGRSSSYVKSKIPNVTMNKETGEISKVEYKAGYLNVVGSHLNPRYLLCASGDDVDLKYLRKIGTYIVRINDPIALLNDIENAKPLNPGMEKVGKCIIEKVLYTKGQIESFDPNSMEAVKRSYIQKPPPFKKECEYRFIVTTKPLNGENPEKFLFFELDSKLSHLEIVE